MRNKKSVLKILSANSECFRVSAGIAPNDLPALRSCWNFKNECSQFNQQLKWVQKFKTQRPASMTQNCLLAAVFSLTKELDVSLSGIKNIPNIILIIRGCIMILPMLYFMLMAAERMKGGQLMKGGGEKQSKCWSTWCRWKMAANVLRLAVRAGFKAQKLN